jgi:isocitrate dehydrogenase (NAD+)
LKIARYAFEYAISNNRKRVVGVHKAGVMKMGDGLFLKCLREIAEEYPQIEYDEKQVDTMCMKLAMHPQSVDLMVMPNLYGDIVSDLCAGLIGGLGLTPSGNIGADAAVFEAVHGTAPDIAGKNMANPTALLLSACMMLDHMELYSHGERIRNAIFETIEARDNLTRDLKGAGSTTQYTEAVMKRIEKGPKANDKNYYPKTKNSDTFQKNDEQSKGEGEKKDAPKQETKEESKK